VPARAAIVTVRGLVVRTPLVPFAQRHSKQRAATIALADSDAPARLVQAGAIGGRGTVLVFDSGWLPYDAGVARMAR
jgi:hypothetical protein